jgi:hypothetical protein
MNNNNDDDNTNYGDWYNWIPIPLAPEEENRMITKYCKDNNIPVTIMRIRDKQGKEWIRLFRKSTIPKNDWIT